MASQNLDFSLPGNVGDTGEIDANAIRPFEDNEDAYAANFNRPLQNLRNRTEVLRKASEDLAYLVDADRAFIIRGGGLVNWAGPTTNDTTLGSFTIAEQLVLRSFLSPDVSTPASTLIYGVKISTRTTVSGSLKPPRAYSGANKIRVIVTGVSDASLGLLIDGTPADNVRLTVNSAASGGTTRQELVDYLNANSTFLSAGLTASLYDGALGSDNIGVNFTVSPTTYNLKGAVDAEKHVISPTGLASFFTVSGNLMREGDTLCIWYDTLTDNTYGGRRQSIAESPENSASVDNNLFLLRKNPERQPLAIPLCTVANGFLIFVNGVGLEPGLGAPVYSGSEGHPYARFEIVGNRGQIRLGKDGETARVTTKDDFDVVFGGGNADSYHTHATSEVADDAMAAITAHLNDNDDAHDASAISVATISGVDGDNVQEALTSINSQLSAHLTDSIDAHDASSISYSTNSNWANGHTVSSTQVQAALDEIVSDLGDSTGADKVGTAARAAWRDSTVNAAGTVQSGLNKIVTDLTATTGAAKIGNSEVIGAIYSLSEGSVATQLAQMHAAVNTTQQYANGIYANFGPRIFTAWAIAEVTGNGSSATVQVHNNVGFNTVSVVSSGGAPALRFTFASPMSTTWYATFPSCFGVSITTLIVNVCAQTTNYVDIRLTGNDGTVVNFTSVGTAIIAVGCMGS
jgi:hypothetical protein